MSAVIALALRHNDRYVFPPWEYEPHFNLNGCFSNNLVIESTYEEPAFHYNEIPHKPNLNIIGYFQTERYFEDYKDDIRNFFTPKQKFPFQKGIASIHVRRTDYLQFPNHHPVSSMSYFESAMERTGVDKFLVFSDDIAWCKQNFTGNQFEFSEGQHEVTDMALQAKCEHNIICNSTFSWWSAWLNKNPNKIVVAPKKWFGPALACHNTKDLYPDNWIVL